MGQNQRRAARLTGSGGLLAAVSLLTGCVIVVGGRGHYRHAYDSDPNDGNPNYEWVEDGEPFSEERRLSVTHEAGQGLVVETTNGMIEVVQGGTDRVRIDAEVTTRWEGRLDDIEIVAERRADGVLHIKPGWKGRERDGDAVSFVVTLPDVAKATLSSTNGGIALRDLDCPVTARTTNGYIELLNVRGPVTAISNNGYITIRQSSDASGPVRAETANGLINVTLGGAFQGSMHASATTGTVSVEGLDALGSSVTRQSVSGRSIRFTVGGSDQPESWARTVNGEVRVTATPAGEN
jgi:hypothetical protein